MKDIIFAGIQASGKGTQSHLFLEKYGKRLKYFETGGILRALQSSDNAIGNHLSYLTSHGLLVKDEIVAGLFGVFMETLEEGDVILADGCFRKIGQTLAIVEKLKAKGRNFVVIDLTIPEEETYKRLVNRRMCKSCGGNFNLLLHGEVSLCPKCGGELYQRNDDADLDAIKTRLDAYKNDTLPTLEWLNQQGYLVKVDGLQTIEEVFAEVDKIIQ